MAQITMDSDSMSSIAKSLANISSSLRSVSGEVNSAITTLQLDNVFTGSFSPAMLSGGRSTASSMKARANTMDRLISAGRAASSAFQDADHPTTEITKQPVTQESGYLSSLSSSVLPFFGGLVASASVALTPLSQTFENLFSSLYDIVKPGLDNFEMFLENHGISFNGDTADSNTVSFSKNDYKGAVESYYHKRFDEDYGVKKTTEYKVSTAGSTTGKKHLIGDIYSETKTDVQTIYYTHKTGNDLDRLDAGFTKTNQTITISEGSDACIDIDLAKLDQHFLGDYNPRQGSVYASGGFGLDAVVVSTKIGNSETGIGSASAGGRVGIGGNFDIGVHNGIIKVEAGAAFGFGIDLDFEINYKNAWNGIKDAFSFKW